MLDTIICGDCLEIMPQIPDKSVDMVLADLPYGTTKLKWDSLIPLEPLWCELSRITKDDSALVFTASQPFTTTLISSNIEQFRYEWIWCRRRMANFLTAKYQPMKIHENILVFSNAPATYTKRGLWLRYNPIMKEGKPYSRKGLAGDKYGKYGAALLQQTSNNGTRYPLSIIEFKNENNKRYHTTQKPPALFEYLIRTYTNEGDTVLDPTCGSGTTAVACKRSDRHYICIEKEADYCAIAEKRLKEML